jgi:predicted nucleotidyltransferase
MPLETAPALEHVLAATSGVRFAMVFGSTARESAGSESDLDIAVDLDAATDLAQLSANLAQVAGREVDIVDLRDAGVPLLEELLRDGVVLYERRPHVAASWRAHVLSDLEVDRGWYARMRDAWLKKVAERGLGDGQP